MSNIFTRRAALQSGAALAAALGLPPTASVAPDLAAAAAATPRAFPSCPCREPDGSFIQGKLDADAAWDFLLDYPDPRVGEAIRTYERDTGDAWIRSQEHLVAAMQAHLPGLAPALRVVADHAIDELRNDGSLCCADGAAS